MRRGQIWTVSGGASYTGKPRPAVIVQDDRFDTDSVTICPFTTDPTDAPLLRLLIEPDAGNGLAAPSRIMADKVTTVRRSMLGAKIGTLDDASMLRLNRALVVFLGIASST
ncbi:MAG: type II toxin-antitoxin system PemK/MazF family toxin [Streptosporangiaceae bacterium]